MEAILVYVPAMNRAALMVAAAVATAAVSFTVTPAYAGGGFVRSSASCPAGKVVLGGGTQVVGEGSADFLTVVQESHPGTAGGTSLWVSAVKNNDPSGSHNMGLYAVCANAGFSGYEQVLKTVSVPAFGFVRTSVSCPAGKVSLSGGASVVGEGSANFNTLVRESSPGAFPSSSAWVAAVSNNDSSAHTIGIEAVCAFAPPGYEIVRATQAVLGGSFLRKSTSCPAGKVSVGGGTQVVGEGSANFGTKLQEISPGSIPSSTAWLIALRNGPAGHTIGTYTTCVQQPSGYEIIRKLVTVA